MPGAYAQTSNSTEKLPPFIERKFKRDAARLALRTISNGEDLRFLPIEIDEKRKQEIFSLLVFLYQNDPIARNLEDCGIHTAAYPAIENIQIVFSSEYSWIGTQKPLPENSIKKIYELIHQYDLVIQNSANWNAGQEILAIRSRNPLNMTALANEFRNITGIQSVNLNSNPQIIRDINLTQTASGWRVSYLLKFKDPEIQQLVSHSWDFEVKNHQEIRFLGENGKPIPDWIKCQIQPASLQTF
ncbi:MAG: hypothetical protein R2769_08915 [Saprospiraceae bacterium]